MADGKLTLSIINNPSLVIHPLNTSTRGIINWIKPGNPTAYGYTPIQGVTARPALYTWKIDCTLRTWEYLLFQQIVSEQQQLGQLFDNNFRVTARDECWYTDNSNAQLNSRSIVSGSIISKNGITGNFCDFLVIIEPGEGTEQLFAKNSASLNDEYKIGFVMKES